MPQWGQRGSMKTLSLAIGQVWVQTPGQTVPQLCGHGHIVPQALWPSFFSPMGRQPCRGVGTPQMKHAQQPPNYRRLQFVETSRAPVTFSSCPGLIALFLLPLDKRHEAHSSERPRLKRPGPGGAHQPQSLPALSMGSRGAHPASFLWPSP